MSQFLGSIAEGLGGKAIAGTGLGATLGNFMGAVNGINGLFGGGQQQGAQHAQQQGPQFTPLPQPQTPQTAPAKTASMAAMDGNSEWENMLKKAIAARTQTLGGWLGGGQ